MKRPGVVKPGCGSDDPGSDVVEAREISRTFRGNTALDSVSFEWGRGVHAVLGPNGAGKTTLLRILGLLDRPTKGQVRLFGQSNRTPSSARGRVGYLPQDIGMPLSFSARDLVMYAASLRGVGDEDGAAVESTLERAQCASFAHQKVRTLSGGERKRVGLAAASVGQPELLLLDEPSSGLDPVQRAYLRAFLREMGETAIVVMTTHLAEDLEFAKSVLVLTDGRVVFNGTVGELAAVGRTVDIPGDESLSALERGYISVTGIQPDA